jgi:hypothetical protein
MECNLNGVIKSSDIKLKKASQERIDMQNLETESLMKKWQVATAQERQEIEKRLAVCGGRIIEIYAVNSRSILRK